MPRPTTLTATPTASDPNGICESQTPAAGGAQNLTQLGAVSDATYNTDADGIMTATAFTGITAATDLITTVDANIGAQGRSFTTPMFLTILSSGDDSTVIATIVGKVGGRVIEENLTLTNAGTAVTVNQFKDLSGLRFSAVAAANISIGTLGASVFATPQHITCTPVSDDSARTLTIVGTGRYGNALSEALAVGNATLTATTRNFATVTKLTIDDDTVGALEVGINGTCETGWLPLERSNKDFNVGFGVSISSGGGMTMKVEHTFNDTQAEGFVEDDAVKFAHESVTAATVATDGNYTNPVSAVRLSITAHTSGTGSLQVIQAGG